MDIDTGTEELLCELDDGVATVTLNKPHKRNALGDNLTPALRQIFATLEGDPRCGAIVLTGAGKAFCSGGDVSGMGKARDKARDEAPVRPPSPEEAAKVLMFKQETLTLRMVELGIPIIAAIPGPAAGAGLSIALAADLRVMAEDTFLTTAFRNIGLSGDYGASWLLTRLVGPAIAKELFFTARRVGAEECLRLGIANRVVAPDELAQTARDMALEIAHGPRTAIRYMKENINRALVADFRTCLAHEAERMVRSQTTKDHREAASAFMEKRQPNFDHPA